MEKEKVKSIKLKTIKPEAVIKIEVGAGFYQRAQALFFWYVEQDQEKALIAIENFKTKEPADAFEDRLLTLLTLLYSIEQAGESQGLLQDTEFPIPQS